MMEKMTTDSSFFTESEISLLKKETFNYKNSTKICPQSSGRLQRMKCLKTNVRNATKPLIHHNILNLRERQWNQTVAKLSFLPQDNHYYDTFPIKPKYYFMEALAKTRLPLYHLQIPIPLTFISLNTHSTLIYYDQVDKCLKKQDGAKMTEFLRKILISESESNETELKPENAIHCIHKYPTKQMYIGSKKVETRESLKELMYGFTPNSLLQKFIRPPSGYATTFRLVYNNPLSKNKRANYCICMKSTKTIFDTSEPLLYRYCLCVDNAYSLHTFTLTGAAIKELEHLANNLLSFILKAFNLKLKQIVADFIKDKNGVLWFTDVKAFEVDHDIPGDVFHLKEIPDCSPEKRLDQIEEKTHTKIRCRICKLNYSHNELTKTLTLKMLFEFNAHLNKRGIFKFQHLQKYEGRIESCKICDLCYMLVVAEHDLIEVGRMLALYTNIPLSQERDPTTTEQFIISAGEDIYKKNLSQWRILFYFNKIFDSNINDLPNKSGIFLQVKLGDCLTKMQLTEENLSSSDFKNSTLSSQIVGIRQGSRKSIRKMSWQEFGLNLSGDENKEFLVNKLRIYYFFTDSDNLSTFLKKTKIEVRLTDGDKWANTLASGVTHPFLNLNHPYEQVQRGAAQVILFSPHSSHFLLQMTVGLKKDPILLTKNIYLTKFNDVYFPKNFYYNVNTLPIEWVEIFEDSKKLVTAEEAEIRAKYIPFCSREELGYKSMRKEHHIKIRSIDSRIPKVMETPRPAYHSHRASEEDTTATTSLKMHKRSNSGGEEFILKPQNIKNANSDILRSKSSDRYAITCSFVDEAGTRLQDTIFEDTSEAIELNSPNRTPFSATQLTNLNPKPSEKYGLHNLKHSHSEKSKLETQKLKRMYEGARGVIKKRTIPGFETLRPASHWIPRACSANTTSGTRIKIGSLKKRGEKPWETNRPSTGNKICIRDMSPIQRIYSRKNTADRERCMSQHHSSASAAPSAKQNKIKFLNKVKYNMNLKKANAHSHRHPVKKRTQLSNNKKEVLQIMNQQMKQQFKLDQFSSPLQKYVRAFHSNQQ